MCLSTLRLLHFKRAGRPPTNVLTLGCPSSWCSTLSRCNSAIDLAVEFGLPEPTCRRCWCLHIPQYLSHAHTHQQSRAFAELVRLSCIVVVVGCCALRSTAATVMPSSAYVHDRCPNVFRSISSLLVSVYSTIPQPCPFPTRVLPSAH